MTTDELRQRTRLLENNIRSMNGELNRLAHDIRVEQETIQDNKKKLRDNKKLPFLVANVVEVLDPPEEEEDDGSAAETRGSDKAVVIKTTTRQVCRLSLERTDFHGRPDRVPPCERARGRASDPWRSHWCEQRHVLDFRKASY